MAQILVMLGVTTTLVGAEPVQSVHPFFDSKEVYFEPRLVGQWNFEFFGTILNLSFVRAAENKNNYVVKFRVQDDSPSEGKLREWEFFFNGSLFKINGVPYLDLIPKKFMIKPNGAIVEEEVDTGLFIAPTHIVSRAVLDGDQLKLAYLDDDDIKEFVHKKHLKVAAESTDFFLLIAPMRKLQSEILAKAEKESLLDSDAEFVRQK